MRGSQTAYDGLLNKSDDTLYFIYEQDKLSAKLYLGSKLIAGDGEGTVGATSLRELIDVVLPASGIENASYLVYDSESSKWVNKTLDELVMIGANSDGASGIGGLVPAPGAEDYDLFLRGDGTWAAPSINHTVLTLENTNKNTHADLIQENTNKLSIISGDIIIIKDLIYGDKWQYTAYVYDDGNWSAMDGNYNAENVYFSENLITTTAIGNITLNENGQAVIQSEGKNLKELFELLYVNEEEPDITEPEVSLTFTQGGKGYEVGSEITPKYSASLSPGTYQFGPATGITAKSWGIEDSKGQEATTSSGDMPKVTITDNLEYTITATAVYGEGAVPLTNLKKPLPDQKILAGSASKTSTKMTAYRNSFYGTLESKSELTSDVIRGLNASNSSLSDGSVKKVNIPLKALRVVFAYPDTLRDLSSVTDTNGLMAEILSSFTKITVNVEGNNHYQAIPYNVYYLDYANPNDKANSYTFTI